MYFAPWVSLAAKRHPTLGIVPGLALDLAGHDDEGKPWDFNDPTQKKKAERQEKRAT